MGNTYIRVKLSGPLFDGDAIQDLHDWIDKTKKDVADLGMDQLDAFTMDKTGRGTGNYQRHMRRTTMSNDDILLDNPLVYGPWLEGTSERNQTTRFKGYRLWRKTTSRLRSAYKDYAEEDLKEYLARMNGE